MGRKSEQQMSLNLLLVKSEPRNPNQIFFAALLTVYFTYTAVYCASSSDEPTPFDTSPVRYSHKYTESTEYNALTDPFLQKHFQRQSVQKLLVAQALATPDLQVLTTNKKAHQRKYQNALKSTAEKTREKMAEDQSKRKQTEMEKREQIRLKGL
eukprot:m.300442 g.300442  ORF g.300442 m.300442 type:complete len:154 (-) comp16421_c1_seq32:748-1209(-)